MSRLYCFNPAIQPGISEMTMKDFETPGAGEQLQTEPIKTVRPVFERLARVLAGQAAADAIAALEPANDNDGPTFSDIDC